MKFSIAISLLILGLGAVIGWGDKQVLSEANNRHQALAAEATRLGISADSATAAEKGPNSQLSRDRNRDLERLRKEADAKTIAAEFIAFAKEMEAIEKSGQQMDDSTQKRIMDLMDRLMSLDTSQLKIIIGEIKATAGLTDDTRRGLIGFSIMSMSNDHPQAALAIFTESSDLMGKDGMGGHVVGGALASWAKTDPKGALTWVRENGEKYPDAVTDDAKQGLIMGAAETDPRLAFQLIGELSLKEPEDAASSIMGKAVTGQERDALASAFRSYVATLEGKTRKEVLTDGMTPLGRNVTREGFDAANEWLAGAKLSAEELDGFSKGISSGMKPGEAPRWIEWMGSNLETKSADKQVREIVSHWTEEDYQAAGTWLAAAPDGPTKESSVRAYAETVARYEPETAAEWAMTLPEGKSRQDTLIKIYRNWPTKDDASAAAAQAFAEKHGIEK